MTNPLLHPFTAPTQTEFVTVVGGHGSTIVDDAGNEYIDAMASLWYMNVGHGRQEMVDAITAQASKLATYHTFSPFSNQPAEQLASKIAALSPYERPRVFLACSGSEAVDSAMKLARIAQREAGHPERQLIISREHGYHGTNFGGTSAQGIPVNQDGFGPLVGDVVQAPAANVESIAQIFEQNPGRVAAVLTEPLQGAGGVFPPADGYLESLRRLCDAHGAYLIFDEVICGFGRLGQWFGAQYYGVTPDFITFAKAVSSGYMPVGGVIVGDAPRAALEANDGFVLRHGYTYSGHPIAAAAALEAIAIQEREGLVARATTIGRRLSAGLQALLDDGAVTAVRGAGAVWAVGLDESRDAPTVRNRVLDHGVVVRPLGNALSMCPPLVITDAEIDRVVDALATVLR
jgi:adenosylmethionine-8-amino-7-oxononanoate aminotransferase